MPVPDEFRFAKDILSERLLQPRKVSEVHGVGVGKVGANKFRLRIYVTNRKAQGLPQELSWALELNGPAGPPPIPGPAMPASFTLGSFFASQFPGKPWLETMIVDVIQAPRAKFAATASTQTEDLPRSGDCKYQTPLNPLPAGLSVWKKGSSEIGTIGFFCKDSATPQSKYLVSCNHVLVPAAIPSSTSMPPSGSANSLSVIGTKICRNGSPEDHIANLSSFVPLQYVVPGPFPNTNWSPTLVNRVDAAIAKMNKTLNLDGATTMKISSWVIGPLKMTGTIVPEYDMKVSKHGYSSCSTDGVIDDILCDFAVLNETTPQLEFLFVEQFRIIRYADNTKTDVIRFAQKGDSGSLIFRPPTSASAANKAVGMLFAVGNKLASLSPKDILEHSGDAEYTLATPIATILQELNDKLVPPGSNISANKKIVLMPAASGPV